MSYVYKIIIFGSFDTGNKLHLISNWLADNYYKTPHSSLDPTAGFVLIRHETGGNKSGFQFHLASASFNHVSHTRSGKSTNLDLSRLIEFIRSLSWYTDSFMIIKDEENRIDFIELNEKTTDVEREVRIFKYDEKYIR